MTVVVALVTDLMDRSRITEAFDDPVTFVRGIDHPAVAAARVLLVDLTRVDDPASLRHAAPGARIVAFGPHVDDSRLTAARSAGLDVVVPRSQFFRDPDGVARGG